MATKLRVGLLGAGEVAQVIHLPTLSLMPELFEAVAVCDISRKNADHCAAKFHIKQSTTDFRAVVSNPVVDVVFILTSDDQHAIQAIAALEAGKHVMIEKPITLSLPAAQRIADAEAKAPNGAKVFIGYMRRYAPSFVETFKREVASIPRILYARSRDVVGPNSHFVGQSGTFQVKNTDFPAGASTERNRLIDELMKETFEGREVTDELRNYARFLGSLGSHDISLMREALGFPESVASVSVNDPFYTAMFNYKNKTGEPFSVTYESGIDAVPRFDAHLTVYGEKKTVSIQYNTPYVGVGGGLPITVRVDQLNSNNEAESKEILCSFESAYTAEMRELHACLTASRPIKTTVKDAMQDLRLFDMMYKSYLRV